MLYSVIHPHQGSEKPATSTFGTGVLTLSFVYKDKSKVQAYLTRKGEFLWYPLQHEVAPARMRRRLS